MAANTPTTSASGGQSQMNKRLLEAATCGDSSSVKEMAEQDPTILLAITPQKNNCLHIASIHGFKRFCEDVLEIAYHILSQSNFESLLSNANAEWETPVVIAVTLGHVSLASFLLKRCWRLGLKKAILQQDRYGFNALHHAIRNGHKDLALELIEAEPELSKAHTRHNESPMFIAALKDFTHVSLKLLEIPHSAYGGNKGRHALHAAASNGNGAIANRIMENRPYLAVQADMNGITPIITSVLYNKVDVLEVLLVHDSSLGYEIDIDGRPLLFAAATRGLVDVAQELLKHCPDAFYRQTSGDNLTCLHVAISEGHINFVEFIMRTPQLQKLVNMQDRDGETALHYAVKKCDPRLVAALLSHKDIDTTIVDRNGTSAASELLSITDNDEKTLDWKEVYALMLKADPKVEDISKLYNHHSGATQSRYESTKWSKLQVQQYTSNTSLVAILLATITFTAAFTLPGGYSSDAGSAGVPIMSGRISFQAFMISDTLAMCSSFVVAFICLMGRWEDDKFTSYYISITKKLTWFAYMTTITAFSTGLYTVLATHLHWLAIGICSLVAFLPILTMFIAKWPVLRLQIRLSGTWQNLKLVKCWLLCATCNPNFLHMV